MKTHNADLPHGWWTYGAYGPHNIAMLEPEFRSRGLPLPNTADGLVVAVPQPQFLPELRGRTMLLENGALALSVSDDGA